MRKRDGLTPEPVEQSTTLKNQKNQENFEFLVSEKGELSETLKNSENSLVQKLDEMNPDRGPKKLIMASSYQELAKDVFRIYQHSYFQTPEADFNWSIS